MTEKEAKTKTCHKTLAPIGLGDNAWFESAACIGSACMAWRWRTESSQGSLSHGYCGLADKP